jgi:hypothetical protein
MRPASEASHQKTVGNKGGPKACRRERAGRRTEKRRDTFGLRPEASRYALTG